MRHGTLGGPPPKKCGLGGQVVVPACGAVADAKIENWVLAGFLFLGQDYFFLASSARPLTPGPPKGLQKNATPQGVGKLKILKIINPGAALLNSHYGVTGLIIFSHSKILHP